MKKCNKLFILLSFSLFGFSVFGNEIKGQKENVSASEKKSDSEILSPDYDTIQVYDTVLDSETNKTSESDKDKNHENITGNADENAGKTSVDSEKTAESAESAEPVSVSSESYDAVRSENIKIIDSGESETADGLKDEEAGISEEKTETPEETDYLAEGYKFEPVPVPEAKRPLPPDPEKVAEAENKDESEDSFEENQRIIKYGTSSEISGVINKIVENDDPRFNDFLYDLFKKSKNQDTQTKIIEYFSKQKDPCLEDYAITVLNEPFDYPDKTVEAVFQYVSEIECKKAAPCVVEILESGNEDYFNAAISVMGKIGGPKEALYMASYLDRDDLKVQQKQTLMRTLGQMCASETWDKLVEIVKDEDENSFVRMYAAEAIGKMKKEDSVPILIENFQNGDPNMRQYCIKGLSNFPDNQLAKDTIIQAVRDEYWKVRLEAIQACKELKLEDSIPYLVYRADKDAEKTVQKECYPVIAKLDVKEGNDFLINQITGKKVPDRVKVLACSALMEEGSTGEKEILSLAEDSLKDDKRKSLRNELGKLFIKYHRENYGEICALYIQSKDVVSVNQGLTLYKMGKYKNAEIYVQKVADEGKNASNRKQARKILGLSDEDEEDEKKSADSEKRPVKFDEGSSKKSDNKKTDSIKSDEKKPESEVKSSDSEKTDLLPSDSAFSSTGEEK